MTGRPKVVVIGSGAAGMAASVAAASEGADVIVLEAASTIGGTTATSGGGIWIPANPWGAAAGVDDSVEEGIRYLRNLDLGDTDPALANMYVRQGAPVTRAVEEVSPLRWQHLGFPDYHAELEGGKQPGRSLEIEPVQVPEEALALVRPDPYGTPPVTINEEALGEPGLDEIARRDREGILVRGRGVIGGLYAALLELGGRVHTGLEPSDFMMSDGAVVGVTAGGTEFEGQVVVASGGFERDPGLVRNFLRGPLLAPAGPPTNRGGALRLGMAAGAALGNMSEAWWCPAMQLPGETIDGAPFFRMMFLDCAKPGGVLVDSRGRRFVDEAANYNDLGRALHDFDAASYEFTAAPSWLVFDSTRHASHRVGFRTLGEDDLSWLPHAPTLEELAGKIGLLPGALRATVDRFNDQAERGVDEDFGRGSFIWDHFSGESSELRGVSEPPFYAVRVLPGCLGTKGGLKTDEQGQVLQAKDGSTLPGLFAAGNAAANPFGCAYPGPGATVGPALVFGWLAGKTAAA